MFNLFIKCPVCHTNHFISFLKMKSYVCSKCNEHLRISASEWRRFLCDKKSFIEMDPGMKSKDPLHFPRYREKLDQCVALTKINEAIITGIATMGGRRTGIGIMDPYFIMASMGSVVGEKVTRLLESCTREKLPVVLLICSGGARMQEGILSLMQMAKTAAAVRRLNDAGNPLFTVLTNPTTGGVTASYAMLGNVIIAEPNALIGFAGPRVIKQTIGKDLPEGFQRSEFLLEHGMIDLICQRKDLPDLLKKLIHWHSIRPASAVEEA